MKRLIFFVVVTVTANSAIAEKITMDFDGISIPALVRVVLGDTANKPYFLDTQTIKSDDIVSAHASIDRENAVSWLAGVLESSGYMLENNRQGYTVKKAAEREKAIVYQPNHRSRAYLMQGIRGLIQQGAGQQLQVAAQSQDSAPDALDSVVLSCKGDECARYEKALRDLDTLRRQIVVKAALYEIDTTRQTADGVGVAVSIMGGRLGMNLADVPTGPFVMGINAAGVKAAFQALDSDSRVSALARPEIRIASGATGRVTVGNETPILSGSTTTTAGTVTQQIQYKSSGVILTVTPAVYPQHVELDISQQLSGFSPTANGVNGTPTLTKREVQTRVTARPGSVLVLGGLRSDNKTDTESKTRWLPDWMSRRTTDTTQTELVLVMWIDLDQS